MSSLLRLDGFQILLITVAVVYLQFLVVAGMTLLDQHRLVRIACVLLVVETVLGCVLSLLRLWGLL